MSREATETPGLARCIYCGERMTTRGGVFLTHGRPLERPDRSGEPQVEPCPGSRTVADRDM